MPLKGVAKRDYQREYMRRKHGFRPRVLKKAGDSKGVKDLDPSIRGQFRPVSGEGKGLNAEVRPFRPSAITDREYYLNAVLPPRQIAQKYMDDVLMGCSYDRKIAYLDSAGRVVEPITERILGRWQAI